MVFALTYDILGFILKGKSTASNDLDSVYDRFYLESKKIQNYLLRDSDWFYYTLDLD